VGVEKNRVDLMGMNELHNLYPGGFFGPDRTKLLITNDNVFVRRDFDPSHDLIL
jgi:hypothetical protein